MIRSVVFGSKFKKIKHISVDTCTNIMTIRIQKKKKNDK